MKDFDIAYHTPVTAGIEQFKSTYDTRHMDVRYICNII